MSDDNRMLEDAAVRFFTARVTPEGLAAAGQGQWPAALWEEAEEMGYTQPLDPAEFWVPEDSVGAEHVLLVAAGKHALPLPLAETMLAAGLLARVGADIPRGPLGLSLSPEARVPWGRHAGHVLWLSGRELILLPAANCRFVQQDNLAGEPRDLPSQTSLGAAAPRRWSLDLAPERVLERAALMRAAQMAGAIQRCLELSIQYANERKQFGRPIGAFQAIQHQLAQMAGQAAAAKMAVLAGYHALARHGSSPQSGIAAAIAKSRAGEAAGIAAAIAHQVHGAMGFTFEHPLQFYSRRLQAWRAEYGSERYWNQQIGEQVLGVGADRLWPLLTETL